MNPFSVIAVIYNPNSTGSAVEEAQAFEAAVTSAGVEAEVRLTPTEYAGHAIELAYELAKNNERPLIVSASGDGGYHEVVNGAMKAQLEGASPVCAVLASGNANDHSRTVLEKPLAELVIEGEVDHIDLLRMEVKNGDDQRVVFGHSYIGLGLTPTVAVELNRNELNRIKETWIVYKTLKELQPVDVILNGRRKRIDSLVMANISQMAKVLTIAEGAEPDDGRFEVTVFPYRRKATLWLMLVKAMVRGIKGRSVSRYQFEAVKDMVIQVDGEVHELHDGDVVTVTSARRTLATLK